MGCPDCFVQNWKKTLKNVWKSAFKLSVGKTNSDNYLRSSFITSFRTQKDHSVERIFISKNVATSFLSVLVYRVANIEHGTYLFNCKRVYDLSSVIDMGNFTRVEWQWWGLIGTGIYNIRHIIKNVSVHINMCMCSFPYFVDSIRE